jgi:hypothetical protein
MVVVALASCMGLWCPSQAAEFTCTGGDVTCLIDAITAANANGEENTITLEAGTYTLTAVDNTTAGPTGLPSVTSTFPLTIQGAGAEATIIERQASAPDFRLVHVAATGILTLEDLTLQGGQRSGGIFNSGGGILISIAGPSIRGTLTLINCTLSGNSATGFGGGIENGGTLTVINSTLSGNSTTGSGGGGIRTFHSLTLINSTISGNSATSGVGGGIYNFFGASIIINSTLSGNSATGFGSGVGGGGGIHNSDATLTLINSTLSGNSATGFGGGGIHNSNVGTLTVTNSTFSGNSATRFNGGGIHNVGTLTLTNSTLSGNLAASFGGGIYNTGIGATALQNTIVALNTADTAGPDCSNRDSSGSVTSQGNNLVGDPTDCTLTLLPSDLTGDPGLDAFTDNGTPGNGHFPLLPTSPAIDAGNDAVCPTTDQLGQSRVGHCDIGAIEFQPAPTSCMGAGAARVRGRVRAADHTGIGEVLVTLTGPAGCRDTVTTNAQGHYGFRTLGPGTYTITVTKDACTFTPAERTVTLAASDVRARFRGTCP